MDRSNSNSKKCKPEIFFIKMEGPLCEKDEQGLAIERMRKDQQNALKNWRLLKNKKK